MFEQLNKFTVAIADSAAVVKITAFFLAWVLCWLPIAIPLAIALKWQPSKPLAIEQKIPLVLSLYALAPLLLWGIADLKKISFAAYGLHWQPGTLISLTVGLVIGLCGVICLFGLERWLNWVAWTPIPRRQLAPILLPTLVLGLLISVVEELIFRGFLLNELQQDLPLGLAAIISSLVFALLHLVWEGWAIAPQLPGLWLMGLVLVFARWADGGSLGLACGVHAGWIWSMASLDAGQMIRYTAQGPEWLTGLKQQPLAGGFGLLLLAATGGVMWLWAINF